MSHRPISPEILGLCDARIGYLPEGLPVELEEMADYVAAYRVTEESADRSALGTLMGIYAGRIASRHGDCDLCGRWDSAIRDGICAPCRKRLGIGGPGILPRQAADQEEEDPIAPSTRDLARRVTEILSDFFPGLSEDCAAHVLTEGLYAIATDLITRGEVQIEHLCGIELIRGGDGSHIAVTHDPEFMQRLVRRRSREAR